MSSKHASEEESVKKMRSVAKIATPHDRAKSVSNTSFHPYGRYDIPISPYGWYRVLVFSQNSGLCIKQVLDELRHLIHPRQLNVYYYHKGGEPDEERNKRATFTFYVDSYRTAKTLQIKGHRPPIFGVRVNDNPPNILVNERYKWKLRNVILSRYDPVKLCLNLTQFHADDGLIGEFCALQRFECLDVIMDIMEQEMPELRRLVLDNNHISILAGFWGVERRFPGLKSISLQQNKLETLHELKVFESLQITDLNIKRNPLPPNYELHLAIMFPHLRVLNEQSLGRNKPSGTVQSDSENDSDVEIVSVTQYKPVEEQPGTRKFVRRYLKAFDGDNRVADLKDFYHDNTLVTVTSDKKQKSSWSTTYAHRLLSSREDVLQMFADWPKTRHQSSTMTLDLKLLQKKILLVSITGNFKEFGSASEKLRHYKRSLVLTRSRETDNFRIANELIYLGRGQKCLNSTQQNLMTKLSAETRLRSRWSRKFLKNTNWDYRQAFLAFRALLLRGEIPEEAYYVGDTESDTNP